MSSSVGAGGHSPSVCARTVKYTPKSPAKNINSLASHTITPTLTMFGRFSVWILVLIAGGPEELVAVVTDGLWTVAHDHAPAGSPVSVRRPRRGYICPGQRDEKASTGCRNSLLA